MISPGEFQDFKAGVQQEITILRRDFNYKVNQISPSNVSVFVVWCWVGMIKTKMRCKLKY